MADLVDENLSASSAETLLEIFIASVAGLDYLAVVTAHDEVQAYGVTDGRIKGTGGILIVEIVALGLIAVVGLSFMPSISSILSHEVSMVPDTARQIAAKAVSIIIVFLIVIVCLISFYLPIVHWSSHARIVQLQSRTRLIDVDAL